MRKIFSLILVFVLIFAFTNFSLAETTWENLPQGLASAYFDELSYLVKTRGIAPIMEEGGSNPPPEGYAEGLGVAYARLLDFDGDGTPELYVVTNEKDPNSLDFYYDGMARQEIWNWENGQLKLIYEKSIEFAGTRVHPSSGILKDNNKYYLTYSEASGGQGLYEEIYETNNEKIYELKDGKFIEKATISEETIYYWDKEDLFESGSQYTDYPDSYQGKTLYRFSYIEDGKEVVTEKLYDGDDAIDLDRNRLMEKYGKPDDGVVGLNGSIARTKLSDVNALLKTLEKASKAGIHAEPTSSKILVNGKAIDFDAYKINDNNYFKLRDLAQVVNNTEKNFEVAWNATKNAINLKSNTTYTPVGGELAKGDNSPKDANPSASKIYKDGLEVNLTAYNINGSNFFKLRDIAEAFDIGVTWNNATKTIEIDTSIGYVID